MTLLIQVMIIVILFTLIVWAAKPKPRNRKRSTKKNDLRVKTLMSRKSFHKSFNNTNYTPNVPNYIDIVNVEREKVKDGERIVGAYMFMRKPLLQRNKQLIRDGIVKRNATLRKHSRIPGRRMVRAEAVEVGGQRMALWHITHCIPYRYCLSDGEVDNLMFMGTAHLNMGAKYDKGYVPAQKGTKDSCSARVNFLKDEVNKRRKNKRGLVLDYPTVDGLPKRYGFVQYSLDDFERLADYLVNSRKDDEFKYGVECFYTGNDLIPDYVVVQMINMTKHKVEFRAKLRNIK